MFHVRLPIRNDLQYAYDKRDYDSMQFRSGSFLAKSNEAFAKVTLQNDSKP